MCLLFILTARLQSIYILAFRARDARLQTYGLDCASIIQDVLVAINFNRLIFWIC